MNVGVNAIVARFASGSENGTYWIAGPDRLVTAAHVVWNGTLAKSVVATSPTGGEILFGKQQITVFPDYPPAIANPFSMKPADNDVAVLRGMVPGGQAFSMQITVATALNGLTLTVCGFPDRLGPMQCAAGPGAIASGHQRVVMYPVGTAGGHSGSPVTALGVAGVVAIHVGGGAGTGFAMAIDSAVADFIRRA